MVGYNAPCSQVDQFWLQPIEIIQPSASWIMKYFQWFEIRFFVEVKKK